MGFDSKAVNEGGPSTISANDYLVNIAGLKVISNYQVPLYLGSIQDGIETAALAIEFDNFLVDGKPLTGTMLIADSAASVPEPATWGMMIVGLGVIGFAARRRHNTSVPYARFN